MFEGLSIALQWPDCSNFEKQPFISHLMMVWTLVWENIDSKWLKIILKCAKYELQDGFFKIYECGEWTGLIR